jgi:NAD(P)-dependent dehydrogenase (short-subunit alcohol dehydrogenase family)
MRVQGRVVLLTGGTGALGLSIAQGMLREGARVASSYLSDVELRNLPESFTRDILLIRANVTSEGDVSALFAEVGKKLGPVEVLVNLVGGFLPGKTIPEVKLEEWDRMMSLNLRSTFLCSREFLRGRKKASFGRVISVAAMTALRPEGGKGPYAVAKGGVVTLTQVMGQELKGTGVTANAIAPSILNTRANRDAMPGEDSTRWVSPEDVTEMVLHLCSEHAGSINGMIVPMVGGI